MGCWGWRRSAEGQGQQRGGVSRGRGQQRARSAPGQACMWHPKDHLSGSVRSPGSPDSSEGPGRLSDQVGGNLLSCSDMAWPESGGQGRRRPTAGLGRDRGWLPKPSAPGSGVCPRLRLRAPPPPADTGRLALGIRWLESTLNFIWRLQKGRPVLV